jgi:hypothetical protein
MTPIDIDDRDGVVVPLANYVEFVIACIALDCIVAIPVMALSAHRNSEVRQDRADLKPEAAADRDVLNHQAEHHTHGTGQGLLGAIGRDPRAQTAQGAARHALGTCVTLSKVEPMTEIAALRDIASKARLSGPKYARPMASSKPLNAGPRPPSAAHAATAVFHVNFAVFLIVGKLNFPAINHSRHAIHLEFKRA